MRTERSVGHVYGETAFALDRLGAAVNKTEQTFVTLILKYFVSILNSKLYVLI
jgi:hypothetical protein